MMTVLNGLSAVYTLYAKRPVISLSVLVCLYPLLAVSKISLALGVLLSICSLFVLVGVAAALDTEHSFRAMRILQQHLPLALIFALLLLFFWTLFRMIANLSNDQPEKIVEFIYYWQLTTENLQGKSVFRLTHWLYESAIICMIFTWLMLGSFASWFSYPLMMFKNQRWSEARQRGRQLFHDNASTLYPLQGVLIGLTVLCLALLPFLTPVLYLFYSGLMYITFRELQSEQHSF